MLHKILKEPTNPSYKNFDSEAFKADVVRSDWSDVYSYDDIDLATECLTRKLRYILNVHAPWVRVQQRKYFAPWITDETKDLIKQRDLWKKRAKDLALVSPQADQNQKDAWNEYKKYRNKINNKKKFEENHYKSEKMSEVAQILCGRQPSHSWGGRHKVLLTSLKWKTS